MPHKNPRALQRNWRYFFLEAEWTGEVEVADAFVFADHEHEWRGEYSVEFSLFLWPQDCI